MGENNMITPQWTFWIIGGPILFCLIYTLFLYVTPTEDVMRLEEWIKNILKVKPKEDEQK